MRPRRITGCLLCVLTMFAGGTIADAADSQPDHRSKGLTVDDLTRGVRSAARNIEKEIPKIGPAIGKAAKSVSGNNSEQTQPRNPSSDKR